jgi:GT2 family glycosyltransferase
MPEIAAVVCTRDRFPLLRRAVRSLLRQDLARDRYEVLVVDNGSSDATGGYLAALHRAGRVRALHEDRPGLSRARNRALAATAAPLVAFLDDDAEAAPGWLRALIDAFAAEPRAACVGGPVRLRWTAPPPPWWEPALDEVMSGVDLGPRRAFVSFPRTPYGTNIAFRGDVFRRLGGFREDLGRKGARLAAGEEAELCLRLEAAGQRILYEPAASVLHLAAPERACLDYIRRRAFAHGRSHALLERAYRGRLPVLLWGKRAVRSLVRAAVRGGFRPLERRDFFFAAGYALEGLRHLWEPRRLRGDAA